MDFVRELDTHEPKKPRLARSSVHLWRDAWKACFDCVDEYDAIDLRSFHQVFEKWVPILNRTFDSPVDLDRYVFTFYYCDESPGPKEILQLYLDDAINEEAKTCAYVVFDLFKFRTVHREYCQDYSRNNKMLVDEARGTINMAGSDVGSACRNPAYYFKNLSTWVALFAFTCHALAHLDTFDRHDHAHYDSHQIVRESPFFKAYVFGVIGRVVNVKY